MELQEALQSFVGPGGLELFVRLLITAGAALVVLSLLAHLGERRGF